MSISKRSKINRVASIGLASLAVFGSSGPVGAEEQTLRRNVGSPLAQLLGGAEGFSHKSLLDAIGKFSKKGSGTLAMYNSASHEVLGECVLKHTDVNANISGYMARVTVTQKFHNSHASKVEAVYTFPLPDEAAVDDMTMKIGDRVIKGDIKERGEARKIYNEAASQGYTVALLDQERPNIFTQSVANVEPGADIDVVISYTQILPFENGQYAFIFPTVVGERFIPGAQFNEGLQGERTKATAIVPDASLISPPVKSRAGHDISLSVSIDGGVPIRNVRSPLHEVETQANWLNSNATLVTLKEKSEIPNRDFILTWDAAGASVENGYLAHKTGDDGYVTLMMMPPKKIARQDIAPREMIFVVDCSGSMSGEPIEKSKQTMHYVLDQMGPRDSFQVIAFSDNCRQLFNQPETVNSQTKAKAHKFITDLRAGGGTYIASAIEKACTTPADDHRLRIVTMMTDGDVGNEFEAVALVKKLRKTSRWFPFGIGNGTNTLILNKLAEEGGGEAKIITLNTPSEQVVKDFYSKISSPVLTDIQVSFDGGVQDVYPRTLSDVWAQKPLYFKARYRKGGKSHVVLKGFSAGKPYMQSMEINLPENESKNASIAQIWARAKVDDLMSQDYIGVQNGRIKPNLKKEIIDTALAHHIMTQYTSFVAVDLSHKTKIGPSKKIDVPVEPVAGTANSSVQYGGGGSGDCFDTTAAVGNQSNNTGNFTGAQTQQGANADASQLQGATNGTIGPQGGDATVIQGVNTSGTVRINNLANVEAMLNIVANGVEIIGIALGLIAMATGVLKNSAEGKEKTRARALVLGGAITVALALAVPGIVNWLVSAARDMNIFS